MIPSNSRVEFEDTYNWVHSPFRLDNRYGYKFIAPPEYYGKEWLFRQSKLSGMIALNETLILEPGFSLDTYRANYR